MLDFFGQIAPAARPERATYKGHNRPAGGFFFGYGRDAVGAGRLVTLRTAIRSTGSGRAVRVQVLAADTGEQLAELTAGQPFWLAPAGEVSAADMEQARIDAAHAEAKNADEIRRLTSGRVTEPSVALTYNALACERSRAAQRGHGALALAIAERLADLQAAYDAEQAERDRYMEEQKARVIAQRAAEAGPDEVVIVPCGGQKLPYAAPAGQMYTSQYHRACRRAAETLGGRVLILSALHGLLTLDQVIAPYDLRMGQPGSVTPAKLRDQAAALGVLDARVTVLAGRAYADAVSAVWPDAERPLNGTSGIGYQLARLKTIATQPRQRPHHSPAPRRAARRAAPVAAGQLALFAA